MSIIDTVMGGREGRMLVLVVDRDPVVRELVAHFLGGAGYAVEHATDGEAALEAALKLRPDVVITEVLLPRVDGLAFCRRLRSEAATRDVPVLVFSILAAAERAREAGADGFLLKPLDERVLVDAVAALAARGMAGGKGPVVQAEESA